MKTFTISLLIVASYLILIMNLALALFITLAYSGALGGMLLGLGSWGFCKFTKYIV